MSRSWLAALGVLLTACASAGGPPCRAGRCGDGGSGDAGLDAAAIAPDAGTLDAAVLDGGATPVDAYVPPDVPGCVDGDGDGRASTACGGDDCADGDALRFPGALEACDGRDDDCDTRVDEGAFSAFFVGAGSTTWRSYDLDCASPAAPSGEVQTVFEIESLARAYFLTATTYHVLDLRTQDWIGNGARSSILPEVGATALVAAYTTPAGHAGSSTTIEALYAASTTRVFVYEIDLSSPAALRFTFPATLSGGAANPVTWTAPPGLLTAYQDVTGTWAPDPRPTCPTATYSAGPYSAYITNDRVLVDDAGSCFVRIADLPIGSFGPLPYAGAPARGAWHHAVYNAGLWLFGDVRLR